MRGKYLARVYYNQKRGAIPFWSQTGDSLEDSDFELVHSLTVDDDCTMPQACERVFRQMNVVDGNEAPATLGIRSMCASDAVAIFMSAFPGIPFTYVCRNQGFERVKFRDLRVGVFSRG